MKLQDWIKENRKEIDLSIRRICPGIPINDAERRTWVLNDESLYLWAKSDGVKI